MMENTVPVPRPGRKNLARRNALIRNNAFPVKIPTRTEDKICLSNQCVWCLKEFDSPRAICNKCRNCQFCGLRSSSLKECYLCSNRDPKEYPKTDMKSYRFF